MSVRKIILLLIGSVFFVQSCSVFRRSGGTIITDNENTNIESACVDNNISGEDLIISRAKIEYRSAEMNRSVNGFIKQNSIGDVLISFRSLAGIEIARVYLDKDSIKIHDRINSILYIQSNDYIERKYGFSIDAIGLLWGDMPVYFLEDLDKIQGDDKVLFTTQKENIDYVLIPAANVSKLKSVDSKHINGKSASIRYDDFVNINELLYPQRSTININGGEIIIDIRIGGAKKEKIKNMKFTGGNSKTVQILK